MQTPLGGPRSGLTEVIVDDALSLAHSPRIRWGVEVLDTDDKLTTETVPAEQGSVTWSYRPPETHRSQQAGAAAEVRRRADLTLAGDVDVELLTHRFRIWAEIQASTGDWVRWNQGLFVATNPRLDDDGIVVRRPLKLADKTWLLAQRRITDPITWSASTNVIEWVKDRLYTLLGETKFEITSSDVTFGQTRVLDAGMTELQVLNAALELAAFDALTASEAGRFRSVPLEALAGKGSERSYGPGRPGKVVTAASVEPLLPSLPNVVRFVARQGPSLPEDGNGIRIKKNQSTGPASIDQRGVQIHETVEVEAENQTELDAIAEAESQRWFAGGGQRAQIQVGWCPAHSDRDVIELHKPRLGLSGEWLVTEHQLPLPERGKELAASDVLMPLTCEQRVTVTEEAA